MYVIQEKKQKAITNSGKNEINNYRQAFSEK